MRVIVPKQSVTRKDDGWLYHRSVLSFVFTNDLVTGGRQYLLCCQEHGWADAILESSPAWPGRLKSNTVQNFGAILTALYSLYNLRFTIFCCFPRHFLQIRTLCTSMTGSSTASWITSSAPPEFQFLSFGKLADVVQVMFALSFVL